MLEFKQVMLCVGQHVFARVCHRRGYRVHDLGGRTVLKTVRGTTSQVSKQCTLSEVVIGIQVSAISNASPEGYSCMCIYIYIYVESLGTIQLKGCLLMDCELVLFVHVACMCFKMLRGNF